VAIARGTAARSIDGSHRTIANVRNSAHRNDTEFSEHRETRHHDLDVAAREASGHRSRVLAPHARRAAAGMR